MMAGRSDIVDIAGEVRIDRPKAVLFYDGAREVWLPKALIEIGDDGTVAMPEWLAHREGLI